MAIARSSIFAVDRTLESEGRELPSTMRAAVYRGVDDIRLEAVPVPEIGPGEILVRVHTCGICGTDLKKIATGSHSAPRIFGHETSGVVAKVGDGVRKFSVGERVVMFHHIPCGDGYHGRHKTSAQCATYKKVGCTAGFEPSGGGFAEYVRVMDWIVERGTVRIPDGISFEQACFVEPVNTCIKGIETLRLEAGETVLVMGQGPIGLILATLAKRAGTRVITSDLHPARLTIANSFGLKLTIDASKADAGGTVRGMTEGRGADAVILAVGGSGLIRPAIDATRPGGRVFLFAQTVRGEAPIHPAAVCVGDGEVLVKVHVALTCGTDLKVYQRGYHARMIVPPALFGHELAGTVEEVGEGVRGFKKGMRVVALNSAPCGMCFYCSKHQLNLCEDLLFNNGAYAEYIRIPRRIVEANMLVVPPNVSFEDAAMTEPLACVLRGLHETGVEIGDTVAVIGGGPIGLMFVQVAKAIGCNVIAVVKRDSQVALARKKGAHEVVQITKVNDPVEAVRELSPERRGADVAIEAVGRPEAWEWAVQMVRKGGTVNFFGGGASRTQGQVETKRLHYPENTFKGTFHHTPETGRRAL